MDFLRQLKIHSEICSYSAGIPTNIILFLPQHTCHLALVKEQCGFLQTNDLTDLGIFIRRLRWYCFHFFSWRISIPADYTKKWQAMKVVWLYCKVLVSLSIVFCKWWETSNDTWNLEEKRYQKIECDSWVKCKMIYWS